MTASDRFMKKVSDYYNDLGYPVTWEGEGSKRSLEIQFKAESGYFTSMIFSFPPIYSLLDCKDEA